MAELRGGVPLAPGERDAGAGRRGFWVAIALAVALLGAADAFLLEALRGTFGSGYNTQTIRLVSDRVLFAGAGVLQDGAFLLLGAAVVAAALRRLCAPGTLFLATILAPLAAGLAADLVLYRIYRVFGSVTGLDLVVSLAGGVGGATREAMSEQPVVVAVLVLALVATAVVVAALGRVLANLRWPIVPSSWRLLAGGLSLVVLGAGALALSIEHRPGIHLALYWKPSGRLVHGIASAATDWDRDGFGWLSRPRDPAPLDGERHPFAIDRPDNGVDENGMAGDLPARVAAPTPVPVPVQGTGARRPDLLIVFLETFRGDLIGRELHGRPVTPFLAALAERGASSADAWAHSPATSPSRAQLFQGRIDVRPGARTLVDDFAERGYEVAYFSGQNDSFRESRSLVGWDRADLFVDARSFEAPTSRTRSPVSLQIAWKDLVATVEDFLASRQGDRPLLLYVNPVDAHFPYHHEGLENLLGVDPVDRARIRPEHAEEVFETYLNAVANVDAAIARIVRAFEAQAPGRAKAVLVTADHGQAFYERGQLGHGQDLDTLQARIPLVIAGLGGTWPEPIGLADLRGLVLANLFREREETLRFASMPGREVFLYTGDLDRPDRIGLRSAGATRAVDLASGRAWRWTGEALDAEPIAPGERDAVIHAWEALRWEALRASAMADAE